MEKKLVQIEIDGENLEVEAGTSILEAAEILNISRATLYNKLNKYNIERE